MTKSGREVNSSRVVDFAVAPNVWRVGSLVCGSLVSEVRVKRWVSVGAVDARDWIAVSLASKVGSGCYPQVSAARRGGGIGGIVRGIRRTLRGGNSR